MDEVWIFDNASFNIEKIKNIDKSIRIIESKENVEIAKALSTMFKIAYDEKINFILSLDQDSICPDNIIK